MPGAPTDGSGCLHEAVLYDSDEEFLGVVVPFLQEGAAVGELCLVALGASSTTLVRAAVGNTSGLTFLDDRYDRPGECDQIEPGPLRRAPHRRRLPDSRGE
jgi:hypothetical protein